MYVIVMITARSYKPFTKYNYAPFSILPLLFLH